ncbi:hypothetical protein C6P45_002900 [Maudiozyma exigua]|uniref:Uncharacterized protein n=1 Tax=Maudiozyma exigua TaxID=34358 RepID=A0A9P6VWH5_MAUEX|nr:hypothetical protein C6P45_002900 [Kazachstania exigua]
MASAVLKQCIPRMTNMLVEAFFKTLKHNDLFRLRSIRLDTVLYIINAKVGQHFFKKLAMRSNPHRLHALALLPEHDDVNDLALRSSSARFQGFTDDLKKCLEMAESLLKESEKSRNDDTVHRFDGNLTNIPPTWFAGDNWTQYQRL